MARLRLSVTNEKSARLLDDPFRMTFLALKYASFTEALIRMAFLAFVLFLVLNSDSVSTYQIIVLGFEVALVVVRASAQLLLVSANNMMAFVVAVLDAGAAKVFVFGSLLFLNAAEADIALIGGGGGEQG